MNAKIALRKALNDPRTSRFLHVGSIVGTLAHVADSHDGRTAPPDELETFTRFTGRTTPPDRRIDELWCCVGRRGGRLSQTAFTPPVSEYSRSRKPAVRWRREELDA